jgi:hypothetical protein
MTEREAFSAIANLLSGHRHKWAEAAREIALTALAAAARQGGDVKQAPGEAPHSGPKGNAQPSEPKGGDL